MSVSTVAHIMERDAPSIGPDASVQEVVARFREEDVPALPVVSDGGRCVGPVTRADVLAAPQAVPTEE